LGKRIRYPASDHDVNHHDYDHDGGANNHDDYNGCANDHNYEHGCANDH
jgi:hypothetical protein